MTAYLLAYSAGSSKGIFHQIEITTHPSKETAKAYGDSAEFNAKHESWAAHAVEHPSDLDFGGPMLVSIYNRLLNLEGEAVLKKFESRSTGQQRVFTVIEDRYHNQPHVEFEAPAADPEAEPAAGNAEDTAAEAATSEGADDMAAKKKAAKKAAKKSTEPKASRGVGKAAGKVSDFRQVRDGTDRQKVLKLMNGQQTAEQISQEMGWGEDGAKKVGQIAFCLSRDAGIGYEFGAKGQLKALYPGDKSYKDAVKKAAKED